MNNTKYLVLPGTEPTTAKQVARLANDESNADVLLLPGPSAVNLSKPSPPIALTNPAKVNEDSAPILPEKPTSVKAAIAASEKALSPQSPIHSSQVLEDDKFLSLPISVINTSDLVMIPTGINDFNRASFSPPELPIAPSTAGIVGQDSPLGSFINQIEPPTFNF